MKNVDANKIVKNINIKKYNQALKLPVVLNINPRSIYNKSKEFEDFVEINDVDLVCMSESWEREYFSVEELLKLDNYDVISNVHQRTGRGVRPLILANNTKYLV